MKQLLRFSFLLLAILLPAITALAHDFEVDGIYYNINGSDATVTYYGENFNSHVYKGSVTIPSAVTYNGTTYPVTTIGDNAFDDCNRLTSVSIPNSVTSIGYGAFDHCTGLTSVTIPNSVTTIDSYAFSGCSGLTEISIPDSVTSIGEKALYGTSWYDNQPNGLVYAGLVAYKYKGTMPSGTSIVLNEGTKGIASGAFRNCSGLISVDIPNSVINIGYGAFLYCDGLTSVDIPNSVTYIDGCAFEYCSGLTSVTIGNSVNYIGAQAFNQCRALTSVTIGNSAINIDYNAFINCDGLKSVHITDLEAWCNINFGNSFANPLHYAHHLYLNGTEVTDLVIPNSVTSISDYAFISCTDLTSVTIGNSVAYIGMYAFDGCSGLTNVAIPNSVTSIGEGAFGYCYGLTSVMIGNSVTTIGDYAFKECSSLANLTIGKSVSSIGVNAFYSYESNLKEVQFNAKNCSIGENAFTYGYYHYPISVTRLLLGEGMECLPSGLPHFSMNSKNLVLPNSIQTIDSCAFVGTCDAVVIGDSIENIAVGAFSDGISVAYVSSSTPRPCSPGAFANPQTLYVPAGCKGKYLMSDGWCEFANIVEGSYIRVTDLTLDMDSATMHKTDTLQLKVTLLPEYHNSTTLEWCSTNTAVATVNSTGLVTALAEGEADICCWVDNKTVACHITVTENHIADSIQLNYTYLLLDWDNIVDLTATVYPDNVDQSVTWTVPENDNIYARVVGNRLRVMAKRSGSVTVTATSVADPSVSADCVIIIQIPDVNGDTSLNIADVTALIDYLLGGNPESINIGDADVNRDGNINIADVTTLIDKLLSGN